MINLLKLLKKQNKSVLIIENTKNTNVSKTISIFELHENPKKILNIPFFKEMTLDYLMDIFNQFAIEEEISLDGMGNFIESPFEQIGTNSFFKTYFIDSNTIQENTFFYHSIQENVLNSPINISLMNIAEKELVYENIRNLSMINLNTIEPIKNFNFKKKIGLNNLVLFQLIKLIILMHIKFSQKFPSNDLLNIKFTSYNLGLQQVYINDNLAVNLVRTHNHDIDLTYEIIIKNNIFSNLTKQSDLEVLFLDIDESAKVPNHIIKKIIIRKQNQYYSLEAPINTLEIIEKILIDNFKMN